MLDRDIMLKLEPPFYVVVSLIDGLALEYSVDTFSMAGNENLADEIERTALEDGHLPILIKAEGGLYIVDPAAFAAGGGYIHTTHALNGNGQTKYI